MANETGHARNLQRFEELCSFIASWGGAYNPGNPDIALINLQKKLANAQTAMANVSAALAANKAAINARETEFAGLRKLVTRVVAYYSSTGAAENKIADAMTFKRKLGAQRAEKLEDDPSTPDVDESKGGISVSQQSYTQLVAHFEGLINLLAADAAYSPNEPELAIAGLQSRLSALKTANTAVIDSNTDISNKRVSRDAQMYDPATGLVDLALLAKKYVKAAFGADSSEYGQIKALEFRNVPA